MLFAYTAVQSCAFEKICNARERCFVKRSRQLVFG